MSNLTTTEKSAAIIAYESVKCRDMIQTDLLPEIVRQYQLVCAYSGQVFTSDKETLNLLARMIERDLRETPCSIDQFKIAVDLGMRTSEVFSANAPATYNKWVRQYLESVRMEIAQHRSKVQPTPVLSEEEKLWLTKKGVMLCYDNYKATGYIQDAGDAVYLYLEGKGVIDIPIEVKQSMFEQARPAAIERIKFKQQEVDRFTAKSLQRVIESAMIGNAEDMVTYEQKKICRTKILKDLFGEMTREELEAVI